MGSVVYIRTALRLTAACLVLELLELDVREHHQSQGQHGKHEGERSHGRHRVACRDGSGTGSSGTVHSRTIALLHSEMNRVVLLRTVVVASLQSQSKN